jgi:hypothetical protein
MKRKEIVDLCQIIYNNNTREEYDHLANTEIHLIDNVYLHICDSSNPNNYIMTLQIYQQLPNHKFRMTVEESIKKSLDWVERNYSLEELQLKLEEKVLNEI